MRYLKTCDKCKKKFSCTEHCLSPEPAADSCLCGDCDTAGEDWQKKCDRQYEVFNPSKRMK